MVLREDFEQEKGLREDIDQQDYHELRRTGAIAGTSLLTGILIGLGIGAIAGLLLAPSSGRQTRKYLRRRYEDTMDTIHDRADDWRERAEDWRDRGEKWASTARGKVTRMRRRY